MLGSDATAVEDGCLKLVQKLRLAMQPKTCKQLTDQTARGPEKEPMATVTMPSNLLSLTTLALLLTTLTFTAANPTPTTPSQIRDSSTSDTTYSNVTVIASEEVWNAQPSCYPIPEGLPSDFNCRDALDQFLQQYGNLQSEYTIARLPFIFFNYMGFT